MQLEVPRPLSTGPLEPSEDAWVEQLALACFKNQPLSFLQPKGRGDPVRIKKSSPVLNSTFFHLLFSVTPKTPIEATEDWKKRVEESVASYVQLNCEEGVLVQALHGATLRHEFAIRIGKGRDGKIFKKKLRQRTVLKSLPGSQENWMVESKLISEAEDARPEVYEKLRAWTLPQSRGGWRLVLDTAPRAQLRPVSLSVSGSTPGPAGGVTVSPAQLLPVSRSAASTLPPAPLSACGSMPGPAVGVTVSGAGGAAVGRRTGSSICAGPAVSKSDNANFFSITIAVKEAELCCIQNITKAVEKYMIRNSAESVLVQSIAGGCLTLDGAMRLGTPRDRNDLQHHLRTRQIMPPLPCGFDMGKVECIVSTPPMDGRHAVYESLRRMTAAAGPGGGGQQPGPPATRTLIVDSLEAPGRLPAVAVAPSGSAADVAALCGQKHSKFIRVVVRVQAASCMAESAGQVAGSPKVWSPEAHLVDYAWDATSKFLADRQIDHILSPAVTGPQHGWTEFVCLASAPGIVDMQRTTRELRKAIASCLDIWGGEENIRHLETAASTKEEFQAARAALADIVRDDSALQLVVECGDATRAVLNSQRSRAPARSGEKRRRTDDPNGRAQAGEVNLNGSVDQAAAAAAASPEQPPSQPPPAAASFAAVTVAGEPQPAFSNLAAVASKVHAQLKASFQHPLDSDRVLKVAKVGLLLRRASSAILRRASSARRRSCGERPRRDCARRVGPCAARSKLCVEHGPCPAGRGCWVDGGLLFRFRW